MKNSDPMLDHHQTCQKQTKGLQRWALHADCLEAIRPRRAAREIAESESKPTTQIFRNLGGSRAAQEHPTLKKKINFY